MTLIQTEKMQDGDKEVTIYYIFNAEIFNESNIWVNTLGEDFTKTKPPLPSEIMCWWLALPDMTVKPGSFMDTMAQEMKPRFSRLGKDRLRGWLDENVPDYDYSGRTDGFTRNQLIAECNSAWNRLHGDRS